ncbi:hypothetical protein [Crateriforma conspicua]|uniref:hypothetical protein n=1 Tax=Crateriforma conspicua TaxID=2527996 RepID=UPI0018CE07CF|nr:hypothetical protein [Crateriforma conspicua]
MDRDGLVAYAEALRSEEAADCVEEMAMFAEQVIQAFWDADIARNPHTWLPCKDGERVGFSRDAPELVKDAFDLLTRSIEIRSLVVRATNTQGDRATCVRWLVSRSVAAGNLLERMLVRLSGAESLFAAEEKRDAGRIKGGKPKFSNAEVQHFIDVAKKRFPDANKSLLIEKAAKMPGSPGKTTFWERQKSLKF